MQAGNDLPGVVRSLVAPLGRKKTIVLRDKKRQLQPEFLNEQELFKASDLKSAVVFGIHFPINSFLVFSNLSIAIFSIVIRVDLIAPASHISLFLPNASSWKYWYRWSSPLQ